MVFPILYGVSLIMVHLEDSVDPLPVVKFMLADACITPCTHGTQWSFEWKLINPKPSFIGTFCNEFMPPLRSLDTADIKLTFQTELILYVVTLFTDDFVES